MPSHNLNAVETRILGCILEKERTTPENYPLSLNSLTLACNQATNRDPVVSFDEKQVEAGLNSLREKKLATVIFGAGSRVQKYRHNLPDHYSFDQRDIAILCVLMLRGPQTPGELRARTERLHSFDRLEEVESQIEELSKGDAPLVKILPARPGQKERRYVQLFSAESLSEQPPGEVSPDAFVEEAVAKAPASRVDTLENEVAALKAELQKLREEFSAFRQQFD